MSSVFTQINQVRKSIVSHLFSPIKLSREQFVDLLAPFRHSSHIRRHSSVVTISRIQLVASLFAVLVPLCAIIDWFVFPWPEWAMMTTMRVVSGVIFALLAWPWPMEKTRAQANVMLVILLLVPPVFYLLSIHILKGLELSETAALVARLYALMPNIVLAGLAIFPLTALEVVLLSLPAFFFTLLGFHYGGETITLHQHGPQLWLLFLVMGVAMFSGMSQLHYMAALVNRAMIDPLTNAFTRRSGGETLDLMFRLSALQSAPMSIAFFDLDKFKSINDNYGHEEGDKALITLAARLREGLRKGDVLVRWGGEEFIAILNNTDVAGARIVIQRLRDAGLGLRPDGGPLTASIGIAERITDNAKNWQELIELADIRMYDAKKNGRDRAVLPNNEMIVFGGK